MKTYLLLPAVVAAFALSACDKPTVVTPPTVVTVPVPGPAGPQGNAGTAGAAGTEGAPGKAGESTTIIVTPPAASAPSN